MFLSAIDGWYKLSKLQNAEYEHGLRVVHHVVYQVAEMNMDGHS